ncbi:substrate carrier protein [Artemisia annua]|uniref:Substrate carrier protein n=1 Tax=Artemisia annua TaxID=35608 RepID=A0A2U1M3M0_ARTAN|nr:substrate carrier protein [Artemisia annua]
MKCHNLSLSKMEASRRRILPASHIKYNYRLREYPHINAPMDMVKTRLMLQRESMSDGTYRNGFHCAHKRGRGDSTKGETQ